MKLKALRHRILVLPDPPRKVTASGIILPRTAQRPSYLGVVVSVGSRVSLHVPELKEGARVAFWPYRGTEFDAGGRQIRVLELADMIGILFPKAAPDHVDAPQVGE